MKKRVIEVYMILLFAGALAGGVETPEPTISKVVSHSDFELPDIEPNETVVVGITEDDLENEEFCDSLELVAKCVEAEAGNQSLEGKRLVADVIFNRVDSPRFPNTIEEVISQKYHFTTFWDGSMERIEPSEESIKAVQLELEKRLDDDVLFFTAGDYNTYCIPAYRVGDHYFGY
jgi:hypothetical protein